MDVVLCWRVLALLVVLTAVTQASENTKRCKLRTDNEPEKKILSLLEPLTNQSFTVQSNDGKDNYTYVVQVCGDADGIKNAGAVQIDKNGKRLILGYYNATQATGGSDWVMLTYTLGEKYDAHCSGEQRKAHIMISCDGSKTVGPLSVVLENRDRDIDCFYLFEIDSKAVCPVIESKLSTGSILLIVCVSCLTVYMISGVLYQRFVVGAKGIDQFPNFGFWSEIGNLSADGCDFVCRSRGSREEPPTYRGVNTETLDEPEERDDHLLPM